MDTSKPRKDSNQLLDDLESIRQLLGDDGLQPPLLTETVRSETQIPLLFDVVGNRAQLTHEPDYDSDDANIPTLTPEPSLQTVQPAPEPEPEPEPQQQAEPAPAPQPVVETHSREDTLLYLDTELRAAAQLIMQDVIDDFAPHIETEIKRRLEARMERLVAAAASGKL